MDIKNIIKSAGYLEFINNIDSLFWELLYSKNGGYISCKSKNAVEEAQNFLNKFTYESSKIANESDFENTDNIIEEKKQEFIEKINEHCFEETLNWVDEVYKNIIDNTLLSVSMNIKNPDILYNRALCAIDWMSAIRKIPQEQKQTIIKKFITDFNKALTSKDEDYFPSAAPEKSDFKIFFKLFDSILKNEQDFLKEDLSKYYTKLTGEDLAFFTNILRQMKIFQKTLIKDEIALINAAFKVLNLKEEEEKYNFIKDIKNDFYSYEQINKKIEENDKINLTKRRIEIYKSNKKGADEYYKNLLTSSNE